MFHSRPFNIDQKESADISERKKTVDVSRTATSVGSTDIKDYTAEIDKCTHESFTPGGFGHQFLRLFFSSFSSFDFFLFFLFGLVPIRITIEHVRANDPLGSSERKKEPRLQRTREPLERIDVTTRFPLSLLKERRARGESIDIVLE